MAVPVPTAMTFLEYLVPVLWHHTVHFTLAFYFSSADGDARDKAAEKNWSSWSEEVENCEAGAAVDDLAVKSSPKRPANRRKNVCKNGAVFYTSFKMAQRVTTKGKKTELEVEEDGKKRPIKFCPKQSNGMIPTAVIER